MFRDALIVGIGGFIGAMARYVISGVLEMVERGFVIEQDVKVLLYR
ncbi:hypothetical protein [Archaeoglobus sp.]